MSPTWKAESDVTSGSSRNSPVAGSTRFQRYWATDSSAKRARIGGSAPRSEGPAAAWRRPLPKRSAAATSSASASGKRAGRARRRLSQKLPAHQAHAERQDERRVDRDTKRALEREAREDDAARGERQEGEEVEGVQEFTSARGAWYSLPLIEERKEETREVSSVSFSKAQKTEVDLGLPDPRNGHGFPRGAGSPPQRADQLSHGAFQVPPEGPSFASRARCSWSASAVGCSST